ncbi:MAG: sugar phosphate isomerase/epimerase [Pirellulales bacterium]|nr:sugar phosphate isomerase/epimerase [Pirellulales bacterium]
MRNFTTRREMLKTSTAWGAAWALGSSIAPHALAQTEKPMFKISLAQWSLHKALYKGTVKHLDFAKIAKEDYGIDGVEYVDQFFSAKAQDTPYLDDMKQRAADHGVQNVLIMIDTAGPLGEPDEGKRLKAVDNHKKWVEAAKYLGCHSIRVNARSNGTPEEQAKLVTDGLHRLSEFAAGHEINVIVENHGGLSSNAAWLVGAIKAVGLPNCGTLPDFGNFHISKEEEYDRYQGVEEMMPLAKAVSAKSYDFDEQGNSVQIDFRRMMQIVLAAGYHGYVGIEYEGSKLDEPEGIRATKALLERVRDELAKA